MAINNGIGRVWAANAGEEGRPAGVGPVWIENIDAITPSGSGGSTYTGGNGIDVDNDNDTISLDAEAQAAIDSYVTNSGSFLTDADLPEVPGVKDLIAGNGINITTTSTDVTISADTSVLATQADLGPYATQTWVGQQGYLTSVPDEYVTSAQLSATSAAIENDMPDVTDMATQTWTAQNYFPIDGLQVVGSSAEATGANIIYIVSGSNT